MTPAVNLLNGVAVSLSDDSRNEECGFDVHRVEHVEASAKSFVRAILSAGEVCESDFRSLCLCAGDAEKFGIVIEGDHDSNPGTIRPGDCRTTAFSICNVTHK